MRQVSGKTVCFVGQPGPVEAVLSDVLVAHGMQPRTFACVDECRESLQNGQCDLMLIDFNGDAASSLGVLDGLHRLLPQIPKIALVEEGDIPTAIRAIRAGAANCLEKPVDAQELCSEIQGLLDQATIDSPQSILTLTRMEKTVLHFILQGNTTGEIAHILHRSPRTIEVHRSHIMHKLDVSNPVELLKTAASMGLLSQSDPDQCTSDWPFTLGTME